LSVGRIEPDLSSEVIDPSTPVAAGEVGARRFPARAPAVWELLQDAGIDPAPERASSTWADFLRSQADALPACDSLETITLSGTRMYVLAVLADAGIKIALSGIQTPRMNAIMERWVRTCRHELLDRTLIWNQRHLRHALREYEHFHNEHRPHQGLVKRPTAAPTTRTDHRSGPDRPAPRPTTRSPRRHPARVRTCRLTCPDEVFGKHTAIAAA
jgi:hypothetical protein